MMPRSDSLERSPHETVRFFWGADGLARVQVRSVSGSRGSVQRRACDADALRWPAEWRALLSATEQTGGTPANAPESKESAT